MLGGMKVATLHLDPIRNRGPVDPRIFGGFLEHMGRAVYEGVYQPDSIHADEDGFRTDVIGALARLKMPVVRYPGGNYVSSHDWKDGIGPKTARKVRPDFAWKSVETNQFGVDEFMAWCKKLGTTPMMAVNLGTKGAHEAAELLEYTNLPRGFYWSDQRPSDEPYGVKMWCMGNEMDGPWQAGHVPAREYAQRAQQAAKIMKGLDPTIETVACGSSGRGMSTYLAWDREVLEYGWDDFDFISAHRYSANHRNDTAWFLAEGTEIERIITDYRSLIGYVRGARRSNRNVYLSFDEWNVWYKNMEMDGGWKPAPHLIEEVYNLEDALVVAQYLNAFIRNADLVKCACIAQIVNIIAPLLTRGDEMLKQTIYYAFEDIAAVTAGDALEAVLDCETYDADDRRGVSLVDVAATWDGRALGLSLVNRSLTDSVSVRVPVGAFPPFAFVDSRILAGDDPKVANSFEAPETLVSREFEVELGEDALVVNLPPLAHVTLRATTSP